MICYLNIMYHFEEGLMADERKLNEQPSINKDYYYYYYYYYYYKCHVKPHFFYLITFDTAN